MKLVSLSTVYTTPDNYEVDGDVTMFFEFTDEQYERLINTQFDHVWQAFEACVLWSSNYWNVNTFNNSGNLKPDMNAFEHTTQTDIYFFPI